MIDTYILIYVFYFAIFYVPIQFNIYWPELLYECLNVLIILTCFIMFIFSNGEHIFFRNLGILLSFLLGLQFQYTIQYIIDPLTCYNWYVYFYF